MLSAVRHELEGRRRAGLSVPLLALALFASGCTETRTLTIELQTDLVPELELGYVEIQVLPRYVPHEEVGVPVGTFTYEPAAADGADLRGGRRVAELAVPPGTYTIRVDARRPAPPGDPRREGTRVRDPLRDVVTTVAHADRVVRVVLLGSCARVTCPHDPTSAMDLDAAGAMDRATECLNGECVDPRCDPSSPDSDSGAYCCAAPTCTGADARCTGDGDCAGLVASCADVRCIDGACIAIDREGACPEDTYCDRTAGQCLRIDGVTLHDAGTPLPHDADPLIDACPPEVCGNGVDDDCDGTLDCEDTECVGTPCDDDEPCTHTDVCIPADDAGRSCAGTPITCVSTGCTMSMCNGTDTCTETPIAEGDPCAPDTNECTNDVCRSGTCVHEMLHGPACSDDGFECTRDTCVFGLCTNAPRDGEACADDGNPCTADVCSGTTCARPPIGDGTSCPGGICCGTNCINPFSDTSHCGVCGLSCAPGRSCQSGQCRCVGPSECVAGGYGPLAGCVDSLCECHCPGGLTSTTCTGQCPGTAHCLARAVSVGPDICEY